MTRTIVIFLLTFLTFCSAYGQSKTNCDCPKTQFAGTRPDTSFYFSNGKTIVLCGYKNPETKPVTFSEFVLSVCGTDTIIDFWGAVLTCKLSLYKDTLLVEQMENLPTAKNFRFQPTVWSTEKIYFKGQKIIRKLIVNRKINKYSKKEILEVLQSYRNAKIDLSDQTMKLGNKLFIATISGDKTARKYFKEFKTHFGILDGAFKEEYNDLVAKLELWDKK